MNVIFFDAFVDNVVIFSQGILVYFVFASFLHAAIKNSCFCLNSPL